MFKTILTIFCFCFLSQAHGMCVSNSNGGIFCYEPLPPIDTTMPPLDWFMVPGGPLIPGLNIGIIDQIDHNMTLLTDNPRNLLKDVKENSVSLYGQLNNLKNMEITFQIHCMDSRNIILPRYCRRIEERNFQLDVAIKSLSSLIFDLLGRRPRIEGLENNFFKIKQNILHYKRLFALSYEIH